MLRNSFLRTIPIFLNRQVSYSPTERAFLESLLSMIVRLMRFNFLDNTKTNIGKLRLGRWKTIEIMKIIGFQSPNFTGKLPGYLFQSTKLWEELVVLTKKWKKLRLKPKEEINLSLRMGNLKFCSNVNFRFLLIFKLFIVLFYYSLYICKMKFKLLSIIICLKVCLTSTRVKCTNKLIPFKSSSFTLI